MLNTLRASLLTCTLPIRTDIILPSLQTSCLKKLRDLPKVPQLRYPDLSGCKVFVSFPLYNISLKQRLKISARNFLWQILSLGLSLCQWICPRPRSYSALSHRSHSSLHLSRSCLSPCLILPAAGLWFFSPRSASVKYTWWPWLPSCFHFCLSLSMEWIIFFHS